MSSLTRARVNMKTNDMHVFNRCLINANSINPRDSGYKRRRRLLAEFLQEESARKLVNAEEETTPQDSEIEVHNQVMLSDNLLSKILVLLPAESLFRLQFVCKQWFSTINSSIFIRNHAQRSETVLICKWLTLLEPDSYAALQSQGSENKPKSYFHFLDLNQGNNRFTKSNVIELADIRVSYDGLILATLQKSKSLIILNPVTGKHSMLPSHRGCNFGHESFGIVFCDEAKVYKVVHLFREKITSIGCEILQISTENWTRIEGPPPELSVDHMRQLIPISIGGSLYWISSKQRCDYFFSMNVRDEKFVSKKLPLSCCSKDRLLEIGGDLGFLSHAELDLLQVWILISDGGSNENWMKKYSIDLSVYVAFPDPICCSTDGKGMVLEMKNELYVYNFRTGELKLIQSISEDEVCFVRILYDYIPHRNTLASWEDHHGNFHAP